MTFRLFAVRPIQGARDAGIDSLIDLTPSDLGRQISLFERIAGADTGVSIICATGVYRWVPMYFLRRPIDEVAEHFLRELQDGIQGSSIRAGIIKVAWDQEYRLTDGPEGFTVRSGLERVARAAARAAKAAGVPVSCHTLAADELGTPLLARAGFAEQVTLGHDASPYYCFAPRPAGTDVSDCWLPVPQFEVPWLREHGATDDQIDAMCRRSIQSTFEAAAVTR